MQAPYIEPFGIHITEPFTWLTNWTLAFFSLYFGHKLYHDPESDLQKKFWSIFFLFIGIGSLIGGTAHGFIVYVGNNFHLAAWIFSGLAVFGAQLASISLLTNNPFKQVIKISMYVELLIMAIAILAFHSFEAVRINSAFGLLFVVAPIQYWQYKSAGTRKNAVILLGLLSNIIPGIIHAIRFSFSRWFNFNDLSHLVIVGCLYLIYRGVSMVERPAVVSPT